MGQNIYGVWVHAECPYTENPLTSNDYFRERQRSGYYIHSLATLPIIGAVVVQNSKESYVILFGAEDRWSQRKIVSTSCSCFVNVRFKQYKWNILFDNKPFQPWCITWLWPRSWMENLNSSIYARHIGNQIKLDYS